MKPIAGGRRDRVRAMLADLKMPGALEAVDGILAQADSGAATAGEAIEQLLGAQIVLRNNRRLDSAMRSSRLPAVKTLAQFDFAFQPSIKREQIQSLHELGFLRRAENVVLLGPPGVGKTHIAISLAIAAAESGRRVYYGTLAGLVESLVEARTAGNLARRLKVLTHPALLVVDEIGYLPVSQDGAVLFFQLINARHERASTVLTSNRGFEEWGLRGMGERARRRGHGGGAHRPPAAPLPHRQHPRQQLPDEGTPGPPAVRIGGSPGGRIVTDAPCGAATRFRSTSGRSAPCVQPETRGVGNQRENVNAQTSCRKVCSFQLPKVCSFRLPLTPPPPA